MSSADDFWLISIPGEKTPQESWEKLIKAVQPIASAFKLNIPNLKVNIMNYFLTELFFLYNFLIKVGTLDQLFGLSDELNKLDSFVES